MVQVEELCKLSRIIYNDVIHRFPDWEQFAMDVECDYDPNLRCLWIKVPSLGSPGYYLSLLERGDCVEISFGEEAPPNIAEQQLDENSSEDILNFLKSVVSERLAIARETRSWKNLFLGDSLGFISTDQIDQKRFEEIISWNGTYNFSSKSTTA